MDSEEVTRIDEKVDLFAGEVVLQSYRAIMAFKLAQLAEVGTLVLTNYQLMFYSDNVPYLQF